MSFKTSCNQRIIENTFYNNTIVEIDPNVLNSLSSIGYVNDEITTVNTEINNINSTLISLQNQINNIQTDINTLSNQIQRITGNIIMSISAIAPAYTLLCDGASYNINDYPALFNIIGYAYGGSNGFFNVPNMESCFPLGANGILNNVPASNLISGNNAAGAKNDYYITGNPWTFSGSTLPNFCILQKVPPHNHFIQDNGHTHGIADYGYGSYSGTQTLFLIDSGVDTIASGKSATGITIQNQGQNIQAVDPLSNIGGVNFTPPFFSVFFYINI
jgi:hypothetical protein